MEMVVKFWELCKSLHVRLLEIGTCPEKIRRVEKESFTFGHNVTNEVAVDFKTFCVCKNHLGSLMPNFDQFSDDWYIY